MKAITIKNPWAFWICSGLKDIENRTWSTNYRGKVLVHVSSKMEDISNILDNYFNDKMYHDLQQNIQWIKKSNYPYNIKDTCGAIIGSVDIVDCVINYPSQWAEETYETNYGFRKPIIYNWVLKNPILYREPLFNVKGQLKLWDVTAEQYRDSYCNNETSVMKHNLMLKNGN